MSLQGLPDFYKPIQGEGFQLFYPYEGVGKYTLVPDRLEVGARGNGRPDFLLAYIRGQNPLLQPPYGVLQIRFRPADRSEAALKFLRERQPGAMIAPAVFSAGFLRLQPVAGASEIPEEFRVPTSLPMEWSIASILPFKLKFSSTAITALKRALQGELMLLESTAELEMIGVSPRLPLRVRFNPAELVLALAALGDEKRQVTRDKIVEFFLKDLGSLPLQTIGDVNAISNNVEKRRDLAEALTDRVRVRFGKPIPPPKASIGSYLELASPASGSFEWDLAQPFQAPRPFVLYLHPLEAARELVQQHGLEAVFQETIVPTIPTGFFPVAITANLPAYRAGILAVGVTIRVPPRPPYRVQAITKTTELKPPDNAANILLQLSPKENLEYTYSTFVMVKNVQGIQQLNGEVKNQNSDRLELTPDDFPVDFIPIDAASSLLELGKIRGICQRSEAGKTVEQTFDLDLDRPATAFALPKGTQGATLIIETSEREGGKMLRLGPFPAEGLSLGLFSFREYGPQAIEIECVFDKKMNSFAIDLLPEGRPETAEEITVINLTRARPKTTWTYFADSPFHPGYRYRSHRSAGEAQAAWSEVRSPFEPLKIRVGS